MIDYTLYSYSDPLELLFCITGYSIITRWFFKQEDKRLLFAWYGYHALLMSAHIFALTSIFFLLGCLFPVVLMLLVIFHEQRLQKMFVVAQRIEPLMTTTGQSPWVDELIKFMLVRLNEQKELRVIIEHQDSIASLVHAQELINADLKKGTLELLYDSLETPKESFLWITDAGKIVALAALWSERTFNQTSEITQALDCIALHSCLATRTFTLAVGTKVVEKMTAHHTLMLLRELTSFKKKEQSHVTPLYQTPYNDKTFS